MAATLAPGTEVPIRSQSVRTPRRPPTASRSEPVPRSESSSKAESSRPHRRSSQRSTSSPRHQNPPEAPAPPPAVSNGRRDDHREPEPASTDPRRQSRHHRYRTTIKTEHGTYAFIKTIGQGSMGKVKLAKKEGTNELASLAVSRPAWSRFLTKNVLTPTGRLQNH